MFAQMVKRREDLIALIGPERFRAMTDEAIKSIEERQREKPGRSDVETSIDLAKELVERLHARGIHGEIHGSVMLVAPLERALRKDEKSG